MINEIIKEMAKAIYVQFGDDFTIYTETPKQELKEPAFFLSCLLPDIQPTLSARKIADLQFAIQFLPEISNPRKDSGDVYEQLTECLEYITVDGKRVRGVVNCRSMSDALTVTVNYRVYLGKIVHEVCMKGYEMEGEIKSDSNQ